MKFKFVHEAFIFKNSLFGFRKNILVNSAHRHFTVKIFLSVVEAGAYDPVEHVGKKKALFCNRVTVFGFCRGIKRLRLEAYASHSQPQTQKVHTELLRGVVVQQIGSHWGLYRTAA